jgi:hypothetical protein
LEIREARKLKPNTTPTHSNKISNEMLVGVAFSEAIISERLGDSTTEAGKE